MWQFKFLPQNCYITKNIMLLIYFYKEIVFFFCLVKRMFFLVSYVFDCFDAQSDIFKMGNKWSMSRHSSLDLHSEGERSHSARHKVTLTRIKWGILIWSKGPFTESTPLPSDQRLQNVKVLLLSGRDGRMGATCDQSKPTTTATGRGGLTRRDTYTWM